MSEEKTLFDKWDHKPQTAEEAATEAIDAAAEAADDQWRTVAWQAIRTLSLTRNTFTAGDVAELIEGENVSTHEPRALGGLMRAAAKEGWIVSTDLHVKSGKRTNHNRPQRVWRSLQR